MERKQIIGRVKELNLDPAHFFISSDAAAILHDVPQNKGPEKIHLIASPELFKRLVDKHGLAPVEYNLPAKVIVTPGVEVSTKFWDNYRKSVDTIEGVPVLRLGKLHDYASTNEGKANLSDPDAIKAKVAHVLEECKKKGKTDRQIGDHLGLSEQSVPNIAIKLLGIKRGDWHTIGRPEPKDIIRRLEETRYDWDLVEAEFFPEKRGPKSTIKRILKGTPEWDAAKRKGG